MKKLTLSLASIVALSTLSFAGGEIAEAVVVATPAPVAAVVEAASDLEISANMTLASRYIWRGMEQINGKGPAIQGGIDLAYKGFYLGTWASNVDFDSDASMEVDVYGGYAGEVAGIGFDVGFISYLYPGDTKDFDDVVSEVYFGVSKAFGDLEVGAKYYYSIADDEDLDGLYTIEGSASYKTLYDITLAGTIGTGDSLATEDDYYYSIGASKEIGKFEVGVTYHGYYSDPADDTTDYIVASISTSF